MTGVVREITLALFVEMFRLPSDGGTISEKSFKEDLQKKFGAGEGQRGYFELKCIQDPNRKKQIT